MDFGFFWIFFGFWILDQFSLRSFCGGPKQPRLDFGVWILDFGSWILDFGFWAWIRITSHRLDPAEDISIPRRLGSADYAPTFLSMNEMFSCFVVTGES